MKKCPEIDYISIGEGEESLPELLDIISKEYASPSSYLQKCKGIAYRSQKEIIITDHRPLIENLDLIPFPSRDIYYKQPTAYGIISSRGCNGHCTFCASRAIHYGKVRTRSIENVIEEVKHIMQRYNCTQIGFYDATFCSSNDTFIPRLTALYNGIVKENIHTYFQINMRPEQINDENIMIINKMINIGLNQILVGFESGNNNDLHLYGKGITVEDNMRAISTLRKLGCFQPSSKVYIEYGFINFHPYSSIKSLFDNGLFFQTSGLPLSFMELCSRMQLYEGAAICKHVKADGMLREDGDFIIDPTNYRFQDENVRSIFEVLTHAKVLCKDNIKHNFTQHYRIWREEFPKNSHNEKLFDTYYSYIKRLSNFCLSIYFQLLSSLPFDVQRKKKFIEEEVYSFLAETKIVRTQIQNFQSRILMDLCKIDKIIIY